MTRLVTDIRARWGCAVRRRLRTVRRNIAVTNPAVLLRMASAVLVMLSKSKRGLQKERNRKSEQQHCGRFRDSFHRQFVTTE